MSVDRRELLAKSPTGRWAERLCMAIAFVPFTIGLGFIFLGVKTREILDARHAVALPDSAARLDGDTT